MEAFASDCSPSSSPRSSPGGYKQRPVTPLPISLPPPQFPTVFNPRKSNAIRSHSQPRYAIRRRRSWDETGDESEGSFETDEGYDSMSASMESSTNVSPAKTTTSASSLVASNDMAAGCNNSTHFEEHSARPSTVYSRDLDNSNRPDSITKLGDPAAMEVFSSCSKTQMYHGLKQMQARYRPEACVFVGNLPCSWPVEALGEAVQLEFEKFGPCYAAVFANANKPHAIVQFTTRLAAEYALAYGNSVCIDRPLRVERSARARCH